MNFSILPTVNAFLNGTSATLLVIAYIMIRQGKREAHKKAMIGAFSTSVVFLISYLTYHFQAKITTFPHEGALKTLYLTILGTHTILAVTVPFLAVISMRRGLAGKFPAHKAISRWTLPIWLYVSVTGVVVYLMLYHL
ncbi:MAG: DUF420 domain-containing protein [Acidobacteriia bacterium]|jgi:uncharacterized membrane protein YozB (DUF420 family)|nr:DUF420 domain-containing protein [Terriglobia bacterium]